MHRSDLAMRTMTDFLEVRVLEVKSWRLVLDFLFLVVVVVVGGGGGGGGGGGVFVLLCVVNKCQPFRSSRMLMIFARYSTANWWQFFLGSFQGSCLFPH